MNQHQPPPSHRRSRRLYRDRRRGWIAGVCAGLSNHWGMPVFVVRLLTVLILLTPFFPFVLIGYIIMSLSVRPEPEDLYPSPEARSFYQTANREPIASISQVRHQMRTIEHRLQKMEAYVTSTEFEFHQGIGERR